MVEKEDMVRIRDDDSADEQRDVKAKILRIFEEELVFNVSPFRFDPAVSFGLFGSGKSFNPYMPWLTISR